MVQSIDGIGEASSVTFAAQSSQLTSARQNGFQAAAQSLGLSASELRAAVANGQSIAELAVSQGLSSTDLQNSVEAALKKQLPNASDSQVAELARRLVEGRRGDPQKHQRYAAFSSENSDGTASASDEGEGDVSHVHIVL